MYYIHNYIEDTWRSFSDWWKLIRFFYRDNPYNTRYYNDLNSLASIAHNENDKMLSYIKWDPYTERSINPVYEARPNIVYDEDFRIINITEIKEALKVYEPREEERGRWWKRYGFRDTFYTFRVDPVPGIGIWRGHYYRSCVKKNKTYVVKLQEFKELFPGDARLRKLVRHVQSWNDDFTCSKYSKSWKKKKKRKQWM